MTYPLSQRRRSLAVIRKRADLRRVTLVLLGIPALTKNVHSSVGIAYQKTLKGHVLISFV